MQNGLEYKEIVCPICGCRDKRVMYPDTLGAQSARFDYNFSPEHNRTYRIVRCTGCSHVYSSPLPVNLWKNYVSVVDEAYLKNQKTRYMTAEKVIAKIRHFCPQGRLLVLAAQPGIFYMSLRNIIRLRGWKFPNGQPNWPVSRGLRCMKIYWTA